MLKGAVPVSVPVKVAVEFTQTGPLLLKATVGNGFAITVEEAEAPSVVAVHFASLKAVMVKVVFPFKAPEAKVNWFELAVMFCGLLPFVVYVMLNGAVPVKFPVIVAVALPQTGPLLLSVTVGSGFTTTVVVAEARLEAAHFASLSAVIANVALAG